MDLDAALSQFDITEANLAKLDALWKRMRALVPAGLVINTGSPHAREYRDLRRGFSRLAAGLPTIDGWQLTAIPVDLDNIFQNRLDAIELGDAHVELSVERTIDEPGDQIDEYRARLTAARTRLVRTRLDELTASIDEALDRLTNAHVRRDDKVSVRCPDWESLEKFIAELDRLLGARSRSKAWPTLTRHLSFAKGCDLWDIHETDWPAVKRDLLHLALDHTEPIPLKATDLGALVASRPMGAVSTALNWSALNDEAFERLLWSIVSEAPGYENPDWLMRTRAPDRGRDLSVWRVHEDALAGTRRYRVIIQCKHWLTRSVGDTDVADTVTKIAHWDHPPVDVLVVATSGRFTADAVAWIERHNHAGGRPRIEAWPESLLEQLLAQRPHLVASFGLR